MRRIRESSEAEMIAVFLGQEYASRTRYGATLNAALAAEGAAASLITAPDLTDPVANDHRRRVFAMYRGYGTGQPSYLTDFPATGVEWFWATATPAEMLAVRYIRYDYWTELSAGSRSPVVAAQRIRAGETAFAVSNDGFLRLADHLEGGGTMPPPILVTATEGADHVVLEGHARVTAWALVPHTLPPALVVLVGSSPAIAAWDEY